MKSNSSFSRRRFLTLGSLGLIGAWAAHTKPLPVRMFRGWLNELSRGALRPKFKPDTASWDSNGITAAWLGHSTVLINFYGLTVLTDPALFPRIGATTFLGTIGPRRLVTPALSVTKLPPVDLVLLSHAHMDHFDYPTLRHFPKTTHAVTARATRDLFRTTRMRKPVELAWGQKTRLQTAHGEVEVEAFEVNHWGARWKYDRQRGYNGYIVSREGRKILYGGDTAWTESFRALRDKGPFDLAVMPIGAYNPWIFAHCNPEQAARMANEAGAQHILPVHFKTFAFGEEGVSEPIERLEATIENQRIGWRDVGQTFRMS